MRPAASSVGDADPVAEQFAGHGLFTDSNAWATALSECTGVDDYGGLRRLEWCPCAALEGRVAKAGREIGLVIRVHHYPPGTSKWNQIEHWLFCHITQNWRGRPLTNRLAVVE
jgi:hypothetical protein